MLLSYTHQFLFVHVPRTGGVSVTRSLAPYSHRPEEVLFNRLLNRLGLHTNLIIGPQSWRWFRIHHTARVMRRHLPADTFRQLFKFAFVRNPWDRAVSFYHHCLEQPRHHRHKRVTQLGSFAKFIAWRVKRRPLLQSELIVDPHGELLVDFLGRFENLSDDFQNVCRQIGIQVRLPKLNASNHRDYRSYYDDATAELTAKYWQRDIEMFSYTFDGLDAVEALSTLRFTPRTAPAAPAAEPAQRRAAA